MTQTNSNKPADTIRLGLLKATIWSNPGTDGKPPRYSSVYSRSYTDESGAWHETTSLGEIDNFKLGHLVARVIDRIEELKADDRNAAKAQAEAA